MVEIVLSRSRTPHALKVFSIHPYTNCEVLCLPLNKMYLLIKTGTFYDISIKHFCFHSIHKCRRNFNFCNKGTTTFWPLQKLIYRGINDAFLNHCDILHLVTSLHDKILDSHEWTPHQILHSLVHLLFCSIACSITRVATV